MHTALGIGALPSHGFPFLQRLGRSELKQDTLSQNYDGCGLLVEHLVNPLPEGLEF